MKWCAWKFWRLAWGDGPRKVVDDDGVWIAFGRSRLYWLEGKTVPASFELERGFAF